MEMDLHLSVGSKTFERGEVKMYRTEHFIASAERDVKIIQSMRRALFAMELVNLSIVEMDGARWRLNFSFEIQQLAETLRLIGVGDDEQLLRPPHA